MNRAVTRAFRASILIIALVTVTVTVAACASPHQSAGASHSSAPPASTGSVSTGSATSTHSSAGVVRPALHPKTVTPAVEKLFAPYDANGRLTVRATNGGAATCFATSIAVPVAGVFRCLSHNTILDPCFAPVHETAAATLTCFTDPWSAGVTIHLSGKLPNYEPVLAAGQPWAIQLINGVRCVSVTGAVPALGAVDLTYQCEVSMAAGITSEDNGAIIAHYGPVEGPLTDVVVATAWRGRSFRFAGSE